MVFMSFVTKIKTAARYVNEHTAYYIIASVLSHSSSAKQC